MPLHLIAVFILAIIATSTTARGEPMQGTADQDNTVTHSLLTCHSKAEGPAIGHFLARASIPDGQLSYLLQLKTMSPPRELVWPQSESFTREDGGQLISDEATLTLSLIPGEGFVAELSLTESGPGPKKHHFFCVTPESPATSFHLAPFAVDDEAARLALARAAIIAYEGMPMATDSPLPGRHLSLLNLDWKLSRDQDRGAKLKIDYEQGRWFGHLVLRLTVAHGMVRDVKSYEFSGAF